MLGIDLSIIVHHLNIYLKFKHVKQQHRACIVECYMVINAKVEKLLKVGFIRESQYPEWIANVVLVKKVNGNWRVCVNLINLNWAYPKDNFSLPRIDQLVDATIEHKLLSFMDAYCGYNQIGMH